MTVEDLSWHIHLYHIQFHYTPLRPCEAWRGSVWSAETYVPEQSMYGNTRALDRQKPIQVLAKMIHFYIDHMISM